MSGVVLFGRACTPTSIAKLRPFPSRGEVTLDLSRTRFISPGGLVGLCLLGRGVRDHGQPLKIKMGTQIASYACRMGLHGYFSHVSDVEFDPPIDLWDIEHRDHRGDLVELTPVAVDDDDQVNDASAAVSVVLAEQLPDLAEREREAIINAVAELLSNVERHSGETEALFTVQAYRWEVVLSVGDAGRGVRASLSHLHGPRVRRMTDGRVLQFATESGVCGSTFGGGYGLFMQRRWVEFRGAAFHLMSGRGYFAIWRGRQYQVVRRMAHFMPGTLAEMHIVKEGRQSGALSVAHNQGGVL